MSLCIGITGTCNCPAFYSNAEAPKSGSQACSTVTLPTDTHIPLAQRQSIYLGERFILAHSLDVFSPWPIGPKCVGPLVRWRIMVVTWQRKSANLMARNQKKERQKTRSSETLMEHALNDLRDSHLTSQRFYHTTLRTKSLTYGALGHSQPTNERKILTGSWGILNFSKRIQMFHSSQNNPPFSELLSRKALQRPPPHTLKQSALESVKLQ